MFPPVQEEPQHRGEQFLVTPLPWLRACAQSTGGTILRGEQPDRDTGNSGKSQPGPHRAMREQTDRNHLLMITEHYVYQWLSRRLSDGISVDGPCIRETAREYYVGVCQKKNIKHPPQFTASKGWLQRFKKRCSLKHAKYQGEISSADKEAAEAYIPVVKQIVLDGNYSHHQLFNCDETGIYWRRTPMALYPTV